jgi:iron complex transport system ATP-binding protein
VTILLDRVTFSWPKEERPLMADCRLFLESGTTAAILGPNGSGKTTLLELILGWKRPGSGRVLIGGADVSGMTSLERGRSMALVPQDERIPFAYSALEYVMLGRAPHLPPLAAPGPRDRKIGLESLDRVGVASLADRPVLKLSGGELRLVLIARALAQEPRILLLDEPANHLDPSNRERVLGMLRSLRDGGITLVLSSHEPDVVSRLADTLVMMKKGGSPESGSVGEMMQPDKLAEIYGVSATIVEAAGRRVILWGS